MEYIYGKKHIIYMLYIDGYYIDRKWFKVLLNPILRFFFNKVIGTALNENNESIKYKIVRAPKSYGPHEWSLKWVQISVKYKQGYYNGKS